MKYLVVAVTVAGLGANGALAENDRGSITKRGQASSAKKAASQKTSKDGTASDPKAEAAEDETIRQTPFGPVKVTKPKEPVRRPVDPSIQVEETADAVTFKRKTPFGTQVWTKKRSDLTPKEHEVLDAIHASESGPKSKHVEAGKAESAATPGETTKDH